MPWKVYAHRVPTTIVRPPIVLGEGDRMGLPLFRSVLRFGVHLSPGLKPQRFSLIHADDLAHLVILAAERGKRLPPLGQRGEPAGQGYYFAACEQDPDLCRPGPAGGRVGRSACAGDSNGHARRAHGGRRGRGPFTVRHQPLVMNSDKVREIAAGSWLCSAQAAKNDLGFAVGAPLIERLRQTAEWYRQEGWL